MKALTRWAVMAFFAVALLVTPVMSQAAGLTSVLGKVVNIGQVTLNGSTYALVYILPSGATVQKSYVVPSLGGNSMVAIALTAMSSDKNVICQTDASGNLVVMYITTS